MEYRLVPPPTPTLRRWRDLYSDHPGKSVLRVLEYEAVSKIDISGDVLDYGGGRNAKYLKYLSGADSLKSANIDPGIDPTHLVEPGDPLPFDDNSFDTIVCFNTLEHIYDAYASIEEIYRVLKPGGKAVVTVPFIFRIHGHPDDYSRFTPSWWKETYTRVGFSKTSLQPLIWGRYTTAGSIMGFRGLFPRVKFHFAHFKDWLYAKISVRKSHYEGPRGQRICDVALGWMMVVEK